MNWRLHKKRLYATLGKDPTCFSDTKIQFIWTEQFILEESLLIWWALGYKPFFPLPPSNCSIEDDVDIYSLSKHGLIKDIQSRASQFKAGGYAELMTSYKLPVNSANKAGPFQNSPAVADLYSFKKVVICESNFSSCSIGSICVKSAKPRKAADQSQLKKWHEHQWWASRSSRQWIDWMCAHTCNES